MELDEVQSKFSDLRSKILDIGSELVDADSKNIDIDKELCERPRKIKCSRSGTARRWRCSGVQGTPKTEWRASDCVVSKIRNKFAGKI